MTAPARCAQPATPPSPLADTTWVAVAKKAAGTILAIPLGATEQHGPHLPLGTDTVVAAALADGLARQRSDVVVAPALAYGASGEHAGFAGTLSIGTAVATQVLVELVRSADAYRGIVLVNAHGGNAEAVQAACLVASSEGRDVLAWTPTSTVVELAARSNGGRPDAHAGWLETSIMLAVDPATVRRALASPGNIRPVGELAGELRRRGVRAVSENGVLGDPTGSSASAGRAILEAAVTDLVAAVSRRWAPVQSHTDHDLAQKSPTQRTEAATGQDSLDARRSGHPPAVHRG